MIDYKEIEEKWQKAWADAKVFEVEPDSTKEGMLVTAAFPYVNAPQHIGHLRTYGTADAYSRYKRMRGFNVLYPMAIHATGTPVLAFARRIRNNDQELIEELRIFHVSDESIKRMTDPMFIANYFIAELEKGMHMAGYGIDWRRTFVSIDPLYSKQVEWQFQKLKALGFLTQGSHPVGWCTTDNSAVGQHDTKHDVQPEIESMTVIKFKDANDKIFFPCATYRPETIYGVTNIFVKEEARYVVAKINDELFYLSKDAVEILKHQLKIQIESEISGKELLGKKAVNPINREEIPVLPGFFVRADTGTGVVMSVPAHAPFDYVALERLRASGYPLPKMEYRKLIEIEPVGGVTIGRSLSDVTTGQAKPEHPEIPALAYLEILHTDPNAIDDMIEFATKLLYREESHWGRMIVGKYKDAGEIEAREKTKSDLIKSKDAFEIHVISNEEPVYCRDGTKVIVKIVENQWFINYGDPKWKAKVRGAFPKITIYPEKYRLTFEKVIDWIDLRAAEREQGLGTKFPFNPSHIIESLSDSTLYMTFYTYYHILKSNDVKPEQLKPEFFDYILLGTGDPAAVARSTGIDKVVIDKCKESFDYWYRITSRHSAPDLIPNHYTMYIFNHVGLLPERYWPKQIVVNGFVNYEGEKMSKSLGNIVPLADGIEKYGADPLRFIEIVGADLDTETEFSTDGVKSVQSRNQFLFDTILSLSTIKSKELGHIDYWLYSKLNSKIKEATGEMEHVSLKNAYAKIYYDSINELKWYLDRGGYNELVLRDFLQGITLMLAPVMPHVAEEFWSALGNQTLAVKEKWPLPDEQMINREVELVENIIKNTIDDVNQTAELTSKIDANKGKRIASIRIIVAEEWKQTAYNLLAEKKNISAVMSEKEVGEVDRERLSRFLAQFAKKMPGLVSIERFDPKALQSAFVEAHEYLGDRFGSRVIVENEKDSKSARAFRALPDRPSIDITWQ